MAGTVQAAAHRLACGILPGVGAWRSLVARTVRVGEVPSSNLGAPIDSRAATIRKNRETLQEMPQLSARSVVEAIVT